jgi:hypothetical protein
VRTDISLRPRFPRCGQLSKPLSLIFVALLFLLTPRAALSSQVTIAWDANSQPQVKGYKLYYGTSSGQYTTNADVENQTAATPSGLQAGAAYFFAATAYDSSGNESNYSQELSFTIPQNAQSQSITLNLPSGWVLLSLPFQLSNPAISTVLAPIAGKYSVVWTYRNGQWNYYDTSDPAGSTLTAIDAGSAYWIKMTSPSQLQPLGASASGSVNLLTGWNFVGYSYASAQPIASVLSSISGKYDLVWSYGNGQWSYYDPTDPAGSTLSQFQPGKGYWIKMEESAIWTLP